MSILEELVKVFTNAEMKKDIKEVRDDIKEIKVFINNFAERRNTRV